MAVSNDFFESQNVVSNFAQVIEKAFNPYDDKALRVPFYLTSSYRKRLKVPGVSMIMNPTQVAFRQAKRITTRDTHAGKVFFHWTNSLGRNNDILGLEFTGRTGNLNFRTNTLFNGMYGRYKTQIDGRGPIEWLNKISKNTRDASESGVAEVKLQGEGYSSSGIAKLANFWNLYALTREPIVDPRTGAPVYYYITYSSPMLGNTFITFIGHFNRVMDFTDDANEPFSKQYSFGFTALSSIPSMDYLYNTLTNNLQTVFINPI